MPWEISWSLSHSASTLFERAPSYLAFSEVASLRGARMGVLAGVLPGPLDGGVLSAILKSRILVIGDVCLFFLRRFRLVCKGPEVEAKERDGTSLVTVGPQSEGFFSLSLLRAVWGCHTVLEKSQHQAKEMKRWMGSPFLVEMCSPGLGQGRLWWSTTEVCLCGGRGRHGSSSDFTGEGVLCPTGQTVGMPYATKQRRKG